MEIKTTEQICHIENDLAELPSSLQWKEFNKQKWVSVDELNKLIDKSDCFSSPKTRAEFNKLVNTGSNEDKKETETFCNNQGNKVI